MPAKPSSIDDYLSRVPADRRTALEQLRRTIHGLLPGAEECISYSMPAFRHQGHVVAGFLATAKGCSYFPFSGTTLATLAAQLSGFSQTKSALHFDPEEPLPRALVSKLLAARIAEETGRAKAGVGKPQASLGTKGGSSATRASKAAAVAKRSSKKKSARKTVGKKAAKKNVAKKSARTR